MFFQKERLPAVFSRKDFQRGQEYYRRGQVQNLKVSQTNEGSEVSCIVRGSKTYSVKVYVKEPDISAYCSCPRFAEKSICKHIAAAMLACADLREDDLPVSSDRWAQTMLRAYTEKSARLMQKSPDQPARLVPYLCTSYHTNSYPSFSFRVGFDKLYVIRDIEKFVDNVFRQETVSYGKGLTLCHAPEQFDEDSQKLISILTDQFASGRSMGYHSMYYSSYDSMLFPDFQKNHITLSGSAFDRMFDLFNGRQVEDAGTKKQMYTFAVRNPEASLSLQSNCSIINDP